MTTPNTVSLPTSPEVRRALDAAGWIPFHGSFDPGRFEQWHKDEPTCRYLLSLYHNAPPVIGIQPDRDVPLSVSLEVAAILGIHQTPTPGMVANTALPVAEWAVLSMFRGSEIITEESLLWYALRGTFLPDMERRGLIERVRGITAYRRTHKGATALAKSHQHVAPSPLEVDASKAGFMLNQGAAHLWRNPACDASPSSYPSVPADNAHPGAPPKGVGKA